MHARNSDQRSPCPCSRPTRQPIRRPSRAMRRFVHLEAGAYAGAAQPRDGPQLLAVVRDLRRFTPLSAPRTDRSPEVAPPLGEDLHRRAPAASSSSTSCSWRSPIPSLIASCADCPGLLSLCHRSPGHPSGARVASPLAPTSEAPVARKPNRRLSLPSIWTSRRRSRGAHHPSATSDPSLGSRAPPRPVPYLSGISDRGTGPLADRRAVAG